MTAAIVPGQGKTEIDWQGTGWRLWRIHNGRLRNPWTNTTTVFWEPGEVQVAKCIFSEQQKWRWTCNGYVSAGCTCGIRSMATLADLARFLERDGTLVRDPGKADVLGLIRIGGKVQHHIPGRSPHPGYQRAEFAEIIGPLVVSPYARGGLLANYSQHYDVIEEVVPDALGRRSALPHRRAQQEWLEDLARGVSP